MNNEMVRPALFRDIFRIDRGAPALLKLLFTLFLFLFIHQAFSQKEGNVWLFGKYAGLDFNSGNPVPVKGSQLNTLEGVATVCDRNGQLLFYTDGVQVWNRNHTLMPKGTGLFGNASSSQSAIIVPVIGDPARYYVFTVDAWGGTRGLNYSVVNMNLASGLGDVETLNTPLLPRVCEKITAVKHCNKRDIWVITHGWNSNAYYAFLVTPSGIQPPVASNTGRVVGTAIDRSVGYLKASPNGTKLAAAHQRLAIDLLDFNNKTGAVSNPVVLDQFGLYYGVEFSPNSALLYTTSYDFTQRANILSQFQVNQPTPAQVVASRYPVCSSPFISQTFYALQQAPDGKIYMAENNQNYLSVINNPDVPGAGCGFVYAGLQLASGQLSTYGLPCFIQSMYQDAFRFSGACQGQQISFSYPNPSTIDSVKWNFGDPASGVNNSSTADSTAHYFTQPGIYTVKLIRYFGCGTDTLSYPVQAGPLNISLGPDTIVCENSTGLLSPHITGNYSYLWQDSSTAPSFSARQAGTYWVEVRNNVTGCVGRDSIQVTLKPVPQFSLGNDIDTCQGLSQRLAAQVPGGTYLWSTGSRDSAQIITQPGTYWLEVDLNGCKARDSVQANFYSYTQVRLGADTLLCAGDSLLLQAGNPGSRYQWQDGSTGSDFLVQAPGTYSVQLSLYGCTAGDTIRVAYDTRPRFTLGPDQSFCAGDGLILKPGLQAVGTSYLWQDGSTNAYYEVLQEGTYSLQLTNHCGSTLDSVFITRGICKLYVPTAFTPNGDGLNDVFRAGYTPVVTEFHMEVFNRWGQKIYATNHIKEGWDGSFRGRLQDRGAFVWLIRYRLRGEAQARLLKGTVILLR